MIDLKQALPITAVQDTFPRVDPLCLRSIGVMLTVELQADIVVIDVVEYSLN